MSEFKIGDIVTFNAYPNEKIKAKVCEISQDGKYRLEGISKALITITSGISIMESAEFRCPIKHPCEW